MNAKREQWNYGHDASIWIGRYKNSQNILHWHHACELVDLESGELDIFCDGERYTVRPGNAFFINSEKVHYMHALTPDTTLRLFVFDYGGTNETLSGLDLCCPLIERDYGLCELYENLKRILTKRDLLCDVEAMCCLTSKLVEIFRAEPTAEKAEKVADYSRLRLLLGDIDRNYEFYDLNRAAEFMAMNPAYLSRLFHKLVGLTFSQYLNFVRCKKAVEMLQSDVDFSITQVATACGFSTIRNFNRTFKRLTGYTPHTLPNHYIMKEFLSDRTDAAANPTLDESILLESY